MRIIELTEEARTNILENLLKRSPNSYGEFEGRVNEIIEKWEQEQITAQQISEAMVERYWFNLYQLKSVASDID